MHSGKHPSLDQIMALLTGDTGEEIEALRRACARCAENLRWARHLLDTARADHSVAPPPATLRRALAIFPVAVPAARPARVIMRRLFGAMVFDSYHMPTLGLTRGGGARARHLRYAVPELGVEIALQLECETARQDRVAITGQVLPAGADVAIPALTAVRVRDASGAEIGCTLYDTGEFAVEAVAAGQQLLLVCTEAEEIAVPIPSL